LVKTRTCKFIFFDKIETLSISEVRNCLIYKLQHLFFFATAKESKINIKGAWDISISIQQRFQNKETQLSLTQKARHHTPLQATQQATKTKHKQSQNQLRKPKAELHQHTWTKHPKEQGSKRNPSEQLHLKSDKAKIQSCKIQMNYKF
jgi:MFS superfamily sulfate permease-like transporter